MMTTTTLTALIGEVQIPTGHKTANKQWYGYKVHTSVDPSSDIVTAVATTRANADVTMIIPLIDKERVLFPLEKRPIQQVIADKAYVGRTEELTNRAILDYTIPRVNMRQKIGTWFRSARRKRPKIERIFAGTTFPPNGDRTKVYGKTSDGRYFILGGKGLSMQDGVASIRNTYTEYRTLSVYSCYT